MSIVNQPGKKQNTGAAKPGRRAFLKGSATTAAGLVIGFHVPFINKQAIAQGLTASIAPEVNAWVVVQPSAID